MEVALHNLSMTQIDATTQCGGERKHDATFHLRSGHVRRNRKTAVDNSGPAGLATCFALANLLV